MKSNRFYRLWLPRILNYGLYCSFCFIAGTGLALTYKLPPGSRGGRGLTMWGMNRHEWGDLHFYVGVLMIALVLTHVILHWGWLKNALKAAKAKLGYLGLFAGLVLFVLPLLIPVSAR